MPNSSGFIDFNQYSDLNKDEEQRLMDEAVARAEEADRSANLALGKSGREAAPRYGVDGQLSDVKGLTQTASYSDYLKAKQNASNAWAAVTRRSADPRVAALQGGVGQGGKQRAGEAMGALDARAQRMDASLGAQQASIARQRGDAAAQAEAQRLADEKRKETEVGWRASTAQAFVDKANARAGAAQRNYIGMYNPYASSAWAQQQGAFDAQQAKNLGASDTQQRGIWDAYTAKGDMGSSGALGRRNPYEPMYREMKPFAPDEEK